MDIAFDKDNNFATGKLSVPRSLRDEPPTTEEQGRQMGAFWLTALGGVLVMLAAMIFVAVNWERISDEAKIGSLALVTGAVGFIGWRLQERLPIASAALSHLAAGLVPVNVAATMVRVTENSDLAVLATAWTAVAMSALLLATNRSIVAELALMISVPIAVIASGYGSGLSDGESALLAIAISVPFWSAGVLSNTPYLRWTGYALSFAGAASVVTTEILDFDVAPNGPISAALIVVGMFVVLDALPSGAQDRLWLGAVTSAVGVSSLASVAGLNSLESYLWPAGLLLIVPAVIELRNSESASSWGALAPGLGLLALAPITERMDGGGFIHVGLAIAVGIAAMAAGAWYRYGAALTIGAATVVLVTILETWTLAVGVDTWVWLGLAGATLIATGIAIERAGTTPLEAGKTVGRNFQAAFR